ncbi:hypothetical protein EVAR_83031_1 [Eumeta japonica]|uniref:Uncharacterized protein n=1 Tax=Eumeta variegata TaxID=151549 RepID=A0A4C1VLJ6_EUMVA|nr:hypothetical protein EVAR_83031_1 [Eumeta japonica]
MTPPPLSSRHSVSHSVAVDKKRAPNSGVGTARIPFGARPRPQLRRRFVKSVYTVADIDSRRTCGTDRPENHRSRECDRRRECLRHLGMKRRRRGRARRPRGQTQAALRAYHAADDEAPSRTAWKRYSIVNRCFRRCCADWTDHFDEGLKPYAVKFHSL